MTEDTKRARYTAPSNPEKNTAATDTNATASYNNTSTTDTDNDHDRESTQIINQIKEITQRMMSYAIKNPDISINQELLEKIVPVLRKDSYDFTDEDEIVLWSSYNDLTQLIKPATNMSLIIADQLNDEMGGGVSKQVMNSLKFWQKAPSGLSPAVEKCHRELKLVFQYLLFSVILYVLVQGYSGLLSDALNDVNRHADELNKQKALIVNESLIDKELELANEQLQFLEYQVDSSAEFLIDLTHPLLWFSDNENAKANCADFMDQKTVSTRKVVVSCVSFQKQYTSSALMILSQYILPLILGVLGATAFIVRNTLEKLHTNSYLPSANGKLSMRLCLGGLLGVISGIFMSTSSAEAMASFNVNLVMISLIMGYSVEVAFSLFDSIVERMRAWTESLKK
ncbi:MAG: hypothetical protein WAX77_15285 [Methylococcaceae bacterium]